MATVREEVFLFIRTNGIDCFYQTHVVIFIDASTTKVVLPVNQSQLQIIATFSQFPISSINSKDFR